MQFICLVFVLAALVAQTGGLVLPSLRLRSVCQSRSLLTVYGEQCLRCLKNTHNWKGQQQKLKYYCTPTSEGFELRDCSFPSVEDLVASYCADGSELPHSLRLADRLAQVTVGVVNEWRSQQIKLVQAELTLVQKLNTLLATATESNEQQSLSKQLAFKQQLWSCECRYEEALKHLISILNDQSWGGDTEKVRVSTIARRI